MKWLMIDQIKTFKLVIKVDIMRFIVKGFSLKLWRWSLVEVDLRDDLEEMN